MHIAIVGAGTIGSGIAQAIALSGDPVILHDIDARVLRVALGRISRGIDEAVREGKLAAYQARRARRAFTITTDLARCAPAELVIEAVQNDRALKESVIRAVEAVIGPETILATTTNSLPITALASACAHPERTIGIHFSRPASTTRAVEVVRTEHSRQDIIERALAFVRHIGKQPILVEDTPGLVINRIAQAYFGEALSLLDEQSTLDAATIDRLMEAAGFPMGPFRLMDFLGIDTVLDVAETMYVASYQTAPYRPHPRLKRMIDAGHTGTRSGRGFYPAAKA